MVSPTTSIENHPDIAEMRLRYDEAAETPTAQMSDGLVVLAGLYLAVSAWIVGFTNFSALTFNNLITGIAVAAIGLGLAGAYARLHGVAFVVPLLGVWTIVAPWAVVGGAHTTRTIVSNVVVGGVIVLFGLATMAVGMARARRSGQGLRPSKYEPRSG
jgi:hypothetical protein